jgi:hypothetical protein
MPRARVERVTRRKVATAKGFPRDVCAYEATAKPAGQRLTAQVTALADAGQIANIAPQGTPIAQLAPDAVWDTAGIAGGGRVLVARKGLLLEIALQLSAPAEQLEAWGIELAKGAIADLPKIKPPKATTTTTTGTVEETCRLVTAAEVQEILGPGAQPLAAVNTTCRYGGSGSPAQVSLTETDNPTGATVLDGLSRSSGTDAAHQTPWPKVRVSGIGEGAVWLADPTPGTAYGELDAVAGGRLLRVEVTAQGGDAGTARTIAEAFARAALG